MPTINLTEAADTYVAQGDTLFATPTTVNALGGNDTITVTAGWDVRLFLGDGDDYVRDDGAIFLTVAGEAGNDRVDLYHAHLSFNGGPGDDAVNAYAGQVDGTGGDGADQFNFFADIPAIIWGEDGNDNFGGNGHAIAGTLHGGNGNDGFVNLRAGPGGLTLEGGPGNDIFRGSAADLNGITIADFSPGDLIILSGVEFENFHFSLSGNTLNYEGFSLTFGAPLNGALTAVPFAGRVILKLNPTALPHQVHDDFNGDGFSDLLLRDENGVMAEWNGQANGSFVGNANVNYPLGNAWHIAGTGDFNDDGLSDLLLRNDNGMIAEWNGQPNGGFVGNANANYALGNDWHVAGIGDFNGDGLSDLLLRNDNGMIAEWNAQSNGSFAGNPNANYPLATSWNVVGTGDFNGDGFDDLLLHNPNSGSLAEWSGQANGSFVGNASVSDLQLGWYSFVVGTGDFNGDGLCDFLLRNTDGGLVAWTGPSSASNAHYGLERDWHIVGIGDFNGDGRSDLLLRNNNGVMSEWTGQPNSSFLGNATVNYSLGTNWHTQDSFMHDPIL